MVLKKEVSINVIDQINENNEDVSTHLASVERSLEEDHGKEI